MRSHARTSRAVGKGAIPAPPRSRAGPARRGSLCGQVLDAATGAAVRGASVVLAEGTGEPDRLAPGGPHRALTDARGRFELRLPRPGDALLVVYAPSYLPQVLGVRSRSGAVVVRLDRAGAIAGRLVERDGAPAAGVSVLAVSRSAMDLLGATTDGTGRFALAGLRPGRYVVAPVEGGRPPPRGMAPALVHVHAGETAQVSLRPRPRGSRP